MASKQAIAKKEMGWSKECPKCANCKNFRSDFVKTETSYGTIIKEKDIHCSSGEFATKKSCWCVNHEFE